MKLYSHPFSTAGRPVRMLIAEHDIECEEVMVDLMQGAHHQPPYSEMNPSRMKKPADGSPAKKRLRSPVTPP